MILLSLAAVVAQAGHAASKPAAASPSTESGATTPVTYENLYDREQYWPYQVRLTEPWKPAGFEGERFGWGMGVLVRVEPSGDLRVDFARHGKHLVPARATNVIEEANRIRVGETKKGRPNFVLAVVNKLVDPTTDPVAYVKPDSVGDIDAYLLVAADPTSEDFPKLTASLAPLRDRPDVMLVLLPQGGHADSAVLTACRAAGWTSPFAFSRFSMPFTASILGEDLALPSLMLQTPEGRVIHSAPWSAGSVEKLVASAEQSLGASPAVVDRDRAESTASASPVP